MMDDALATPLTANSLARPATLNQSNLPPSDQLMPFLKEDRIIWMFRRAVLQELGAGGDQVFAQLAASVTLLDQVELSAGFARGLADSIYAGVTSTVVDLTNMIAVVLKTIGSGMSTVLDPQVWDGIRLVMNARPDSVESRHAIEEIHRFVGAEHTDFVDALVMGTMVLEALRGLASWVANDPGAAGFRILSTLVTYLGKLIGEVAAEFSQAKTPFAFGNVLGSLTGTIFIAAARLYFGI